MAWHRKVLRDRPEISLKQIGTICFDPLVMWDLLFLEQGWIDLYKWIAIIPERFHDEALHVAYKISQRSTFKRRVANVRILEYFILVYHRQVEIAYRQGFLSAYGWLISDFQPIEQIRNWDRKVRCKPYSMRKKCPKIALRKRQSLSGLKLRRVKRKLRKKTNA